MIKSWKPESTICQTMSCLCLEGKKWEEQLFILIYMYMYIFFSFWNFVSFNYLNRQSGSDFTKENLS